jgi:hypothetical protein
MHSGFVRAPSTEPAHVGRMVLPSFFSPPGYSVSLRIAVRAHASDDNHDEEGQQEDSRANSRKVKLCSPTQGSCR